MKQYHINLTKIITTRCSNPNPYITRSVWNHSIFNIPNTESQKDHSYPRDHDCICTPTALWCVVTWCGLKVIPRPLEEQQISTRSRRATDLSVTECFRWTWTMLGPSFRTSDLVVRALHFVFAFEAFSYKDDFFLSYTDVPNFIALFASWRISMKRR